MGYTKDLWTRPEPGPDGKPVRVRNTRWGKGKRWLACWIDPDGREKSHAFRIQAAADKHWQAMETDKERGDYRDPNAGKVLFGDLGQRWLASRVVDPSSLIRYETVYRLHIEPVFGRRQVRAIKPSQIQAWLGQLSERFEPSTVISSLLVLQGVLDLAVADDAIKTSPAKSKVVAAPGQQKSEIQVWADDIPASSTPTLTRCALMPELAVSSGMREGELFGVALEDFDFDEKILRVRRQIKNLGGQYILRAAQKRPGTDHTARRLGNPGDPAPHRKLPTARMHPALGETER